MTSLILRNEWALGDTVCLSALVRDVHRAHPGKYQLWMEGHYRNVFWRNNPHAAPVKPGVQGRLIKLEYLNGIRAAGRGEKVHFLSWFHKSFAAVTGITVPVTEPKGDIHLSAEERKAAVPGRYWVVVAGGKKDMTAKVWAAAYWQQTVDALTRHGLRFVQAGAQFRDHFHPLLGGVDQRVGKTNSEREFFSLIHNAEGVICGITSAMHVAAAFDKPCVVIAGGREEPWWEAYTNAYFPHSFGPVCSQVRVPHRFLHTMGVLDCGVGNLTKGCWRDRAVPIEQADHTNPEKIRRLCKKPATVAAQSLPKCMAMITPAHAVEAVLSYYEDGTLPPP